MLQKPPRPASPYGEAEPSALTSFTPDPNKSWLDNLVGNIATGVADFGRGALSFEYGPLQGQHPDTWASRTGARLKAPLSLGASLATMIPSKGLNIARGPRPTTTSANLQRLSKAVAQKDPEALGEIQQYVSPDLFGRLTGHGPEEFRAPLVPKEQLNAAAQRAQAGAPGAMEELLGLIQPILRSAARKGGAQPEGLAKMRGGVWKESDPVSSVSEVSDALRPQLMRKLRHWKPERGDFLETIYKDLVDTSAKTVAKINRPVTKDVVTDPTIREIFRKIDQFKSRHGYEPPSSWVVTKLKLDAGMENRENAIKWVENLRNPGGSAYGGRVGRGSLEAGPRVKPGEAAAESDNPLGELQQKAISDRATESPNVAMHEANPEQALLEKEQRNLFVRARQNLSEADRGILDLSLENIPVSEKAQALGMSLRTFQRSVERVMQRLRNDVQKMTSLPPEPGPPGRPISGGSDANFPAGTKYGLVHDPERVGEMVEREPLTRGGVRHHQLYYEKGYPEGGPKYHYVPEDQLVRHPPIAGGNAGGEGPGMLGQQAENARQLAEMKNRLAGLDLLTQQRKAGIPEIPDPLNFTPTPNPKPLSAVHQARIDKNPNVPMHHLAQGRPITMRSALDQLGIVLDTPRSLRRSEYDKGLRDPFMQSRTSSSADRIPGGVEYLQPDVEEAYKRLTKRHHPDMPGGDTAKMQAINEAFAFMKKWLTKRGYWE